MLRNLFILVFLFCSFYFYSQEDQKPKLKDRISISGFVKYMNTSSAVNLDTIITDNLIHNRLRFKMNISDNLTSRRFIDILIHRVRERQREDFRDQYLKDISVLKSTLDKININ